MTELLSPAEVAAGWSALEAAASYRHLRPLTDAAFRCITEAQTGRRLMLGIPPFDAEMRGISPGHLALIVGYSHTGKTLVALHVLRNNWTKRVAWFSPDEPAPLVLTKLASLTFGIAARELEYRVSERDDSAVRMLNETVEAFGDLVIFDQPLTPRLMRQGYEEACEHWGAPADLVVVDYLDLLQTGNERLPAKADFVKSFATDFDVPMIVLHQTSRSAGADGRVMRIDSGNYGGETWAMYQLGVRRKIAAIGAELSELRTRHDPPPWIIDRIEFLEHQLPIHEFTVSVNLNKNKRPGGHTVDEIDFELDHVTGGLRLLNGDLPEQYRRTLSWENGVSR